jgi:predicted transcriptional regulator
MTPETFFAHRTAAKLSQASLAAFLGLSERQIKRYESGASRIPNPVRMIVNNLLNGKLPKPISKDQK